MNFRKFPFYRQLDSTDCGPTCIRIISSYFGLVISADRLRPLFRNLTKKGVSMYDLSTAAEHIGMKSVIAKLTFKQLINEVELPCIVHWKQNHFVVVYRANKRYTYLADPAQGLIKMTNEDFVRNWAGEQSQNGGLALVVSPTPKFFEFESEKPERYGFKFLRMYFKPFNGYLVQLILGLFFGSLIQLIFPFLAQSVVDYGINYQNIHFITLVLMSQLALFISQATVDVIRSWILLHMTSRINIAMISDYILKLLSLPISFFDSKNTGDIIQRVYDHNRIQAFLSNTSLTTLFSLFNVLIFGVVLIFYSPSIFFIFCVGSVLYTIWTTLFFKLRTELDYKRFNLSAQNQNSLFQLIHGIQEIKLNRSERRRRWEWENIQGLLFKVTTKSLSMSQLQSVGGSLIFQLQNIFITFFSAKLVIAGELTLGMMLAVQYIIGQLTAPINNLIAFIQSAQDAKISLERLAEIHNKEEEQTVKSGKLIHLPDQKSIKIENLSYGYDTSRGSLILDNISFDIPQNKITAIVGLSGSGKTTLIKLLLGFYEPKSGKILIGGLNLNQIDIQTFRGRCGAVMQDGYIFDDSILRNITEGDSDADIDDNRLLNAISAANLNEFIEELKDGLSTKIGPIGLPLSGGQRQRVLIARCIYKNPDFIFLDEATNSLDSINENAILDRIQELKKTKTVIIVTHRISTLKCADQIVVLEKGKVMESGDYNTLSNKRGSYFNVMSKQLGNHTDQNK